MRTVLKGSMGRQTKRALLLLSVMVVGILWTQACSGDEGSAEMDKAAMVALFHATNEEIAVEVPGLLYFSVPHDQWETDPTILQWKAATREADTLLDVWETFLDNIEVFGEGEAFEGVLETDGNGRITLLHVGSPGYGSLKLDGEIPSELGNMSKLKVLTLGGWFASIPPELGRLRNLEVLTLGWYGQGGYVEGEIPSELGNLRNLRELHLRGNRLTGEMPPELGNLRNLRVLDLYGNRLAGEIPPELGNLRNLRELKLNHNQLTGEIPPELGSLRNLRVLDLSYNAITGEIPPELRRLRNLEELHLDGNALTGPIPSWLGNLDKLYLGGNELTGCKPSELRRIRSDSRDLRKLNLPWCEDP